MIYGYFKISGVVIILVVSLMTFANSSSYILTSCKYSEQSRYIWIKFDNGVQDKGISFVSDGVIFDSAVIGMTYAKDYAEIQSIRLGKSKDDLRLLSVEYTEDNQIKIVDVGFVDDLCWKNVELLFKTIPESQHIKLLD